MRKLLACIGAASLALSGVLPAWAATPTAHYSFQKPTIGADANNWGSYNNSNWDSVDSDLYAVSQIANAACPKAGCTYTGAVTFSSGLTSSLPVVVTTPNSGSSGAIKIIANATSNFGYLQFLDPTGVSQWGVLRADSSGLLNWSGSLNATGGFAGNAATATKLATARTLAITGDLTWTSPGFDGSGNVTAAGTLATVNANVGTCGDATHVAQLTLNAKGLATSCAAVSLQGASTASAGVVALATAAQAQAGSDTTHAVTPASLGANCNPAAGYCVHSGGWVHEWGVSGSINAGSSGNVTLPYTCPTSAPIALATATTGGTNGVSVLGSTTTTITIRNNMGGAQQINWSADCY